MTSTTELFTAEQELAFIRKIVANNRAAAIEDGIPYIYWGLIVAAGMINTYISALINVDLATGWVWMGLVLAGWITTFIYVRRSKHDPRPRPLADRFQGAIWGACGSTIGIVVILFGMNAMFGLPFAVNPLLTCSIAALILGIANYLSGQALELRWLKNLGYAWWASGIAMFFMRSIHVLGLYALMLLLLQVIPGALQYRHWKRSQLNAEPA